MVNLDLIKFDYPTKAPTILKALGVGGGGGNAVTQMYNEDIQDVNFVLCNTDRQALSKSPVPNQVQIGPGLGAGGNPEVARQLAEENIEKIKHIFDDETEMVFITAGMGGGTGTGASPVVARVARELGILTIGIVTIPFMFEDSFKIVQALKGVEAIKKNVDALLVINNERLRDVYSKLSLLDAFKKADDTLTIAVRSISEIITVPGLINLDFADVKTVLQNGGVAIMSYGLGKGDNRVSKAIDNALNSPLINNNDIFKAKKILFNILFSSQDPLMIEELTEIHNFMAKFSYKIQLIWGTAVDESLGDNVKFVILASGYAIENIISMTESIKDEHRVLDEKGLWVRPDIDKKDEDEDEDDRLKYEAELIKKYYGEEALRQIGQVSRPLPFIFKIDSIDNSDTIEVVINNPAFNRSHRVSLEIANKAEARKKIPEEPAA